MDTNNLDLIKAMITNSPDVVIAVNKELMVIATSTAFNSLLNSLGGNAPEPGISLSKIDTGNNSDFLKIINEKISSAINGKSETTVYKLIDKYFELLFFPLKTNGDSVGVACVFRDVTKQKQAEDLLMVDRKIFSLAAKLAKLGPWQFDVKDNVFIFNDEVYAIYGTSVEKEGGTTMSPEVFSKRIVHPDQWSAVGQVLKELMFSGKKETTKEFETKIVRVDNHETRIIKVLAKVIKNEEGNIIEFYGSNQDITDQRETEERLKRTKEIEETIFDSVPAWIFFKDKENRFIRVNKAYAEVMGMTKEEAAGKSLFDIYPKDLAEKYWSDDKEVMRTGVSKINIIESATTKDGVLWVRTDKIPYKDFNGDIVGVIGFVVDITQQKKAEDEIKEKIAELEKFNKMFVDRELRMIELKEEIAKLKQKSG